MPTPFTLKFKNEYTVYENLIKCTVEESEFNLSYNPSLLQNKSEPTSSLLSFTTGSNFTPYATTVGLYNDNNELLMVAKTGTPIPISQNSKTTFLIRYDN